MYTYMCVCIYIYIYILCNITYIYIYIYIITSDHVILLSRPRSTSQAAGKPSRTRSTSQVGGILQRDTSQVGGILHRQEGYFTGRRDTSQSTYIGDLGQLHRRQVAGTIIMLLMITTVPPSRTYHSFIHLSITLC